MSSFDDVDDNVENKPWKEFLRIYKNDKDIIRLGYVQNLDEVFKKAAVYCQPSLYEGFGLPLLEAFQRNVPVVASKTQALVEIGANACLYVDPKDPKDIARGLMQVMKNAKLEKELIRNGKERLKNFSWKKSAQATLRVYEKV